MGLEVGGDIALEDLGVEVSVAGLLDHFGGEVDADELASEGFEEDAAKACTAAEVEECRRVGWWR